VRVNSHSPQRARAFHLLALFKELPGKKDCHQAPIRNTSEPYSSSGLLHTRVEFGHNCQAIHRACSFLATNTRATKVREPLQCSCRTQKSPRLSRVLVLVVVLGLGIEAFCQDEEGSMEKASGGGFARATRKTDEDGHCFNFARTASSLPVGCAAPKSGGSYLHAL
jgi:hypothetical protein